MSFSNPCPMMIYMCSITWGILNHHGHFVKPAHLHGRRLFQGSRKELGKFVGNKTAEIYDCLNEKIIICSHFRTRTEILQWYKRIVVNKSSIQIHMD